MPFASGIPVSADGFPRLSPSDLELPPIERAYTIPSKWYVEPSFHALDLEAVLGGSWHLVGAESQIPGPGDRMVSEAAGNPIVTVRDETGEVRAFYNICRHRGGPVATCDGTGRVLQCQYHGWTYGLDGSLRGMPRFDHVELFDKKSFGLVPLATASWQGLIFVHLDSRPPSLTQRVSGLAEHIACANVASMRFARKVSYDVSCNWKAYIDNYLEGYHIPFVHPELAKLYDYRQYRTETYDNYSLQRAPLTPEENLYSTGGGEAFYCFIFPNIMLNILPGRMQTNVVLPLAPDKCRVVFWYYYAEIDSPAARQKIEQDIEYSDGVQREDMMICEHVQRGLSSRAYDRGRFSVEQEQGVYHFQSLLVAAYRDFLGQRPAARGQFPAQAQR
jgi:choline monooxygenase